MGIKRQETEKFIETQDSIGQQELEQFINEQQVEKMRKIFRRQCLDKNIFIHKCNNYGCKKWSMLLNCENCLLCGSENHFYDASMQIKESDFEMIQTTIFSLETADQSNLAQLMKQFNI